MLCVAMIIRNKFLDEISKGKKADEILDFNWERPLSHGLHLVRVDLAQATTYNESKHFNLLHSKFAFDQLKLDVFCMAHLKNNSK